LILGLSLFLVGGVRREPPLAVSGWIVWAVFVFLPLVLEGVDAILSGVAQVRPLVYFGKPISLAGAKAKWFGAVKIAAGLGSMIFVLVSLWVLLRTLG
jgi:hypothetical protein